MIYAVLGTRPEVIKLAPVVHALRRLGADVEVVATGQHQDWSMMGAFLDCFALEVDHWLKLGSSDLLGRFVEITASLGQLVEEHRPELVLAVGDTTTVVAAAFAARKGGSHFGHIEAGLRAFARDLPEEEHRICADAIADLAFAPTRVAVENLMRERVNGRVLLTGNPILDSLRCDPPAFVEPSQRQGVLITLHRQETVDNPATLSKVLTAIENLARRHVVEWPLHPRTRDRLAAHRLALTRTVRVSEPLGYREFVDKLAHARLVVTDSGGVQEEAAILGTPCVVARRNTERPETVDAGVAIVSGIDTSGIIDAANEILAHWQRYARPVPHLYGDGRAGERIAAACAEFLAEKFGLALGDYSTRESP